ncbi:MAG TPA: hypothetical protein VJX30_07110, partial [Terriglobales bacterium]|nr:hypothetical protein [Terriglobales bacterium]
VGSSEGGWHSFGTSSGASARGASGFAGGASRGTPGFAGRDFGGRGFGLGYGFGRGYGWGWGGWGFGFGWPYWGFGWGLGWAPWWYNPYWYAPWPAYGYPYYSDYGYDWSDNPPYRMDPSEDLSPNAYDYDLPGGSVSTSSSTTQPEAAPNSPAPATQPQPSLVAQPET